MYVGQKGFLVAIRILSALVGILIGLAVLFVDNLYVYCLVLAFIGAVGVYEIIRAVKREKHKALTALSVCFAFVVPFFLNIDFLRKYIPVLYILYGMGLFLVQLICFKNIRTSDVALCGGAGVVIPFSLSCLLFVRYLPENSLLGISLVFFMLFCAWFGDSGAYFAGTFFGKHKLCPEISPKKTVEGFVGGIITVGIVAFIHCFVFNTFFADGATMSYLLYVPVGMAACVAGVFGDLSASIIKRKYSVKDFGNIMPGHGGVLDRFDSVLFVAPFIYMVFSFLNPQM